MISFIAEAARAWRALVVESAVWLSHGALLMPALGGFGADHDSYLPHLALAATAAGVVARETDGAAVARACRADLAGKNHGASAGGGGSRRRAARSSRAPRPRHTPPRRAEAATRASG